MSKYRKLPVIIEAESVTELIYNAKNNWSALPNWIKENYEKGKIFFLNNSIEIMTDEGRMRGEKNDYIIKGIHNEIYPCKPDIFNLTYEKLD